MVEPTPIRPMGFDQGGGDGDDGRMEARLAHIETRLTRIEDTMATKEELRAGLAEVRTDMHKGFSDQTKWIIGTSLGMAAAGITVMTFVLNNATPKAPAAPAQPTVIVLPAAPPASRP